MYSRMNCRLIEARVEGDVCVVMVRRILDAIDRRSDRRGSTWATSDTPPRFACVRCCWRGRIAFKPPFRSIGELSAVGKQPCLLHSVHRACDRQQSELCKREHTPASFNKKHPVAWQTLVPRVNKVGFPPPIPHFGPAIFLFSCNETQPRCDASPTLDTVHRKLSKVS